MHGVRPCRPNETYKTVVVELVVRPSRRGTASYWLRSLLANVEVFWGFADVEDEDAPAVVARGADGREMTVLRAGSVRQAEAKLGDFRRELDEVGPARFVQRYGLPGWLLEDGGASPER